MELQTTSAARRLDGEVDMANAVRQARLRTECAEHYPTLPARMWTSATRLAGLVVSYQAGQPKRSEKPGKERTLSEADFEFRGGFPRWSGGWFAHTRTGELTYHRSG